MIYLVRHGETELNKQRKFYGALDVLLNETGIKQGKTLYQKLAQVAFKKIYSSGLQRTQVTARLIRGTKDIPLISLPELNEKDFGMWEGMTADEIQQAFPTEWQNWLDDPFGETPPNAEGFEQFRQRVIKGFSVIKNENTADPILLVGHLGALRVIYQSIFPDSVFWEIDIPQDSYLLITDQQLKRGVIRDER